MLSISQERGNRRICWYAASATDFQVSGKTDPTMAANGGSCCSYGADGAGTKVDCAIIPSGESGTNGADGFSRLCGRSAFNFGVAGVGTVCSCRTPFSIRFRSNNYEFVGEKGEALKTNAGFRLAYVQDAMACVDTV